MSREQEPCWRKPGKTRHNPAELNWRKPGTQRNLAAPGGAAEPSGTRRNPAETWRKPGRTRRKKSKLKGGVVGSINHAKNYTPNHPPFNLLFFRRIPPGFRQVSAGFRQVPPGSAGFRQVSPGFGRFLAGFHQPRASARLARSRQVCVKFLFPSFCQAPAVSSARPVTTSHNLSVLFPKQFSAELSAQHCLPEGRCLSSFALKSRSTQPTCPVQCAALDAGDLYPSAWQALRAIMKTRYAPGVLK